MFKRIAVIVAGLIIAAWLIVWLAAQSSRSPAPARREWGMGLGATDDVPKRYAPRQQSEAGDRLIDLAANIGIELDMPPSRRAPNPMQQRITEYVSAAFARTDDRVPPPPPDLAEYLRSRRSDLGRIRRLLVSPAPVIWPQEIQRLSKEPIPNLVGNIQLARVLTANALYELSSGDQADAADDLRAAWKLAQSLWGRPELITNLVALAETRMVNGAVRKLDRAPAWWDQVQRLDVRRMVLAAQQADTWSIRASAESAAKDDDGDTNLAHAVVDIVAKPYLVASASAFASAMREAASAAASDRRCAPDLREMERRMNVSRPWWSRGTPIATTNLMGVWLRVGRFRAERELTSRIFDAKAGRAPILASECSDGSWIYSGSRIQFSRAIPVRRPQLDIPLAYDVGGGR